MAKKTLEQTLQERWELLEKKRKELIEIIEQRKKWVAEDEAVLEAIVECQVQLSEESTKNLS